MNKLLNFAFLFLFFYDNLYSMQTKNNSRPLYTHTVDYTQQVGYISCTPQFGYDGIDLLGTDVYNQNETQAQAYLQGALNILEQYENLNALYPQNPENQADLLATIADIDTTIKNLSKKKKFYQLINNKNIAPLLLAMSSTVPCINFLCLFEKYSSLQHQSCPQTIKDMEDQLLQSYYPFHQNFETLLPILPRAYDAIWNINRTMILHYVYQSLSYQKNILVDASSAYKKQEQTLTDLATQKNKYTNALMQLRSKNNLQNSLPIQEPVQIGENQKQIKDTVDAPSSQKNLLKISTKTTQMQKQQQEKIAAEKRAEQSRIDKERHQAALKEQALVVAEKLTPTQKNKPAKKKKKSTPAQLIIDEDDAYLDQLIAENNKSVPQAEKTNIFDDSTTAFVNFIENRNQKILALQQAKEAQRKKDFNSCLKTAAKDRDNKKYYLEQKRDKDFSYDDENEKLALQYIQEYIDYVLTMKCIDENFITYLKITTQKLIELENQFALQGTHLKWYLITNSALYKKMKAEYVQLNRLLYKVATSGEHAIKVYHLQEIAETLQKIHTAGGILDITEYMYTIKTKDEIDQLTTMSHTILEQAERDIQLIYTNVSLHENHQLLQPIIHKLLQQANITTQPLGLIDEMIGEAQKISKQEVHEQKQSLEELDIQTFQTLQKVTEMSNLNFTEHTIANLTKIYVVVISSLVKIIQQS